MIDSIDSSSASESIINVGLGLARKPVNSSLAHESRYQLAI